MIKLSDGSCGSNSSNIALVMIFRLLLGVIFSIRPRSQKLYLCNCIQNLAALLIFSLGMILDVVNDILGTTAGDIKVWES